MQQVEELNAIAYNTAHEVHVKSTTEKFAEFKSGLEKATQGRFVRERGDCCCTGAEMPPVSDVRLSDKEFKEMKEILSLAEPLPILPRSEMKPYQLAKAKLTDDGTWDIEWVFRPIDIGLHYPIDKLKFLDGNGQEVLSLGIEDAAIDRVSKAAEFTHDSWQRTCLKALLPDGAFERYENHPARMRFEARRDAAEKADK